MTPVVAMVADDLTGAGDTAVQFLRAGWSTELRLASGDGGGDAEVVATSTDSRSLPASEAGAAVAARVRRLRESGARRLYKKVDSTLRGPIRAEIDAALAAWSPGAAGPDPVAVVCPAYPAAGRTVRDGVLLVDGVPVHRTAVGADPVTPVRESRVPDLLGAAHVRLTGATPDEDAALLRAAAPVAVTDAETDDDLRRVAAAVARLGAAAVPVGSAGLAAPMAGAWAAEETPGPALVVVTSPHQATRGQVAVLARVAPHAVETPARRDLRDDAAWEAWSAAVEERYARASGEPVVALVAPDEDTRDLDSRLVARRFGALAAGLARRHPTAGLVVTGGDGARAVVDALDAGGIALAGEIAPGIPIGTLTGGPSHGRLIVTKAGGFGTPEALLEAASAVRHRRQRA